LITPAEGRTAGQIAASAMCPWARAGSFSDVLYNPRMKATRPRLVLAALVSFTIAAHAAADAPPRLAEANQMVLVVTADWNDVQGELRRFERDRAGQPWRPVGNAGTIVVGKNGMAWDPLTPAVVPGPKKAEGDGRSPAGVFPLGRAFGFAPAADVSWLKVPYLPVVEGIECVDDPASSVYNQIVDRRQVRSPDWNSSEKMREVGEAYRWGVVVDYNTPAVATRGSCIFLHIGGEGGKGTAGCTAMSAEELRVVMAWLDPVAHPVLVQLPRAAYDMLRTDWSLP
jgi:L,D-peptidoglycan transpeptidase YkuD (ErfK/YbiS/YcfS/YnhG family)